ncbi:hypothetical protein SDC9_181609 [bioreactor metagenome]|uniref:Uncharacterized protein n=1 Tax=bioreactor metagenome TaxID=1076179 RepID=A0A645H6I7_9ZZZZ
MGGKKKIYSTTPLFSRGCGWKTCNFANRLLYYSLFNLFKIGGKDLFPALIANGQQMEVIVIKVSA